MIWEDGAKYIGQFENDTLNGYGRFYWPGGQTYEGMWEDGKKNGYGILTLVEKDKDGNKVRSGVYEGNFKDDLRSGPGKMKYENHLTGQIDTYDGTWK